MALPRTPPSGGGESPRGRDHAGSSPAAQQPRPPGRASRRTARGRHRSQAARPRVEDRDTLAQVLRDGIDEPHERRTPVHEGTGGGASPLPARVPRDGERDRREDGHRKRHAWASAAVPSSARRSIALATALHHARHGRDRKCHPDPDGRHLATIATASDGVAIAVRKGANGCLAMPNVLERQQSAAAQTCPTANAAAALCRRATALGSLAPPLSTLRSMTFTTAPSAAGTMKHAM